MWLLRCSEDKFISFEFAITVGLAGSYGVFIHSKILRIGSATNAAWWTMWTIRAWHGEGGSYEVLYVNEFGLASRAERPRG